MKLQKANNDWGKAIWIIHATMSTGCSMATVLGQFDPFFYKFSNRLSEVEQHFPKLTIGRETRNHKSVITGKTKHYTHYTCLSPLSVVIEIYNDLNKNGFKGKTNKQ